MFVYNVDIPKLLFDEHLALHLFWSELNSNTMWKTLIDCHLILQHYLISTSHFTN